MKFDDIGDINRLAERYDTLTDLIARLERSDAETVEISFDGIIPPVRICLSCEEAEAVLDKEKNRLERALASMGVEIYERVHLPDGGKD
jgi:hypothetical protein